MQATDIPSQLNSAPFGRACALEWGMVLDPHMLPCLWNALLLEPERPIDVVSLLLSCRSYTNVLDISQHKILMCKI